MLPGIVILVLTSVISVSYSTNQPSLSYRSGKTTPDRPLIFGVPFGTGVYSGYPQPQNLIGGLGGGSLPIAQRVPLTITYPNRYTNFRPPPSPQTISVNKQTLSELVTLLNTHAQLSKFGGASDLYDGFDTNSQTNANEVPKQTGNLVVYPLDKMRSTYPGLIHLTESGGDGYLVSLPEEIMPILKHNIINMMNYDVSSANGGLTPNLLMVLSGLIQSQQQLQQHSPQRPAIQQPQRPMSQQPPTQLLQQQSPQRPVTQLLQQQSPQQSQQQLQQQTLQRPVTQPSQRPMSQQLPQQPTSPPSSQKVQFELPAVQKPIYAPSSNDLKESGYQLVNSGSIEPYPEPGLLVVPNEVKSVGFQLIPGMFRLSKSISNESRSTTEERTLK